MNKRVLSRRLEKVAKKKALLQALVDTGRLDPQTANEDMTAYLKKHLALAFRKQI